MDVSLTVSQVSRVAVIGANGAGKSTAIKVLVGEQLPTEGPRAPNKRTTLRIMFVQRKKHEEKHIPLPTKLQLFGWMRFVFVLFCSSVCWTRPQGSIWKAQGLRLAYVAQHAFHHLEKHMQETPTAPRPTNRPNLLLLELCFSILGGRKCKPQL